MPSKGLPVPVLCHREFIEASSHLAWVCFIVQFIGLATWSVRANPVTAQQKAKLRGVRGCRTGRLTGWLTLFPKRIASCQSLSCHLDRNPFFGCNPHRLPFCHSGPHRDTHISSFLSILHREQISHQWCAHTLQHACIQSCFRAKTLKFSASYPVCGRFTLVMSRASVYVCNVAVYFSCFCLFDHICSNSLIRYCGLKKKKNIGTWCWRYLKLLPLISRAGNCSSQRGTGLPPLRTCSHYLISSGGLFQKSPYDGSICVQCWQRLVRLESGHSSCLCVLYKLVLFVLSTQKGSEGCQLCLLSPSMAMCVCWRERGQVGGAKGLTDQCGQVEDSHYRGGRCTVPAFFAVALCVSLSAYPVYLFIYLG